jgi:PUA domain protein
MSSKSFRRYFLRDKESKSFVRDFTVKFKVSLKEILKIGSIRVEVVETDRDLRIFVISGKPLLVKKGEDIFPSLMFSALLSRIPRVVVDMGAVPHVCDGADVMVPGIVRVEGDFEADDIVVIVDERHGKPLAVGKALGSSEEIRNVNRGKAVKNLHFIGDKTWKYIKSLLK